MKTYVCSDLHGMYNLYEAINNFLQPDDIVYFLGDAVDRGPDSWKLMKAIYNNPQWIYLQGNHERMLAATIDEYCDGFGNDEFYNYACNGGADTFESWLNEGAYQEWSKILKNLPTHEIYINEKGEKIYLSHAGFTPTIGVDGEVIIPDPRQLISDRFHFSDEWDEENFFDTTIIHGHTPIPFLLYTNQEKIDEWNDPGAYYYCGDHKINIDCGACWINATVLLDLDTFDEYIFQP